MIMPHMRLRLLRHIILLRRLRLLHMRALASTDFRHAFTLLRRRRLLFFSAYFVACFASLLIAIRRLIMPPLMTDTLYCRRFIASRHLYYHMASMPIICLPLRLLLRLLITLFLTAPFLRHHCLMVAPIAGRHYML